MAAIRPISIEGEVRAETPGLAISLRGEGDALVMETDSLGGALRALRGSAPKGLIRRLSGPLEMAEVTLIVRRRGREIARLDPARGPNLAGRLLGVAPARVSLLNLLRP